MAEILAFPINFAHDTWFMDMAKFRYYARTGETRPLHELPVEDIKGIIQDAQTMKDFDCTGMTALLETSLDAMTMERNLAELYDPFQYARPCWDQEPVDEWARR
jgi:hypothetical protein